MVLSSCQLLLITKIEKHLRRALRVEGKPHESKQENGNERNGLMLTESGYPISMW